MARPLSLPWILYDRGGVARPEVLRKLPLNSDRVSDDLVTETMSGCAFVGEIGAYNRPAIIVHKCVTGIGEKRSSVTLQF